MQPRFPKATTLPSKQDFDPYGGCLDAQWAWRNFGELTLDQAYDKFIDHPDYYQEDFMFMGPKAFVFYFPVIERFLFEAKAADVDDDCCSWILACCIKVHFAEPERQQMNPILDRVSKLAEHVQTHLSQYALTEKGQRRINKAWQELRQCFAN